MSALAALGLYLATALVLALLTRWLLSWDRGDGPRLSRLATALLLFLPLAFTGSGFLPGKVLAPTNTLTRVAPWKDPELVTRVEKGSTAPNLLLVDPVAQFLPWRQAARSDLLFNPSQGSGAALLANGQSALLFPTEIAARWLSPLRAVAYSQAARLLVAAFGLFLLVRSLGGSGGAALAGAAVFVGSGYLQLWRLHPHSLTAAMVPWVVWAAIQLARSGGAQRPGLRAGVALAVTGALGLAAGHPETLLHGVVLAAVPAGVVIARRWRSEGVRRGLLHPVVRGVCAALLAGMLAAPVLLPFLENLVVSAEWQRRGEIGGFPPEAPWDVATAQLSFAVTPWAYGDPRRLGADGVPPGPNNAAELGGGAVGAAALLLVVAAFVRGADRRTEVSGSSAEPWSPHPALWLGLGLVGVLVGAQVPGISRLLAVLPLMGLTILGRLSLWTAVAAAVLAAVGWDRLKDLRGEPRRRPVFLLAIALVGLPLVLVAVLLPASRAFPGIPLEALALVAAAVAIACLVRGRFFRSALLLLAFALVLPRAVTFHGWIPVASSLSFYPDTLAVRHVLDDVREGRDAGQGSEAGWRVAGMAAAYLPHSAAFHGLEEARAYDPMTFGPYQRFLELWGEAPPRGVLRLLEPAAPGLAFLGVRWIFDHPSMTHRPGVEVVYAGRDALVYENPRALPRVFVPREVEVVDGEEEALRVAGEIADFSRRVALHGGDLPPAGRYPNGAARVVERKVEPGRLSAVVEAKAKAVVATSQPAIPGWRLSRDGEEYEPLRVNGAFLAAAVEPGTSRLEWRYAPRSWRWGWVLFGVGMVVVAVLGTRRPVV